MVIVEDEAFVSFVRFITEDLGGISLTLPKRAKLRQETIAIAEDYRRRVKKDIADNCEYYSITCDIWSARNAKSYISLTIHYVTQDFNSRSWTLEVLELPGIHDGSSIAASITRIMETWSLLKHMCVLFLRDSGANMIAAGEKLNIKHMACVAHSLHLVVAGALVKRNKANSDTEPGWAAEVEAEHSEGVAEREEETALLPEERVRIEELQEFAIEEMETFLDETFLDDTIQRLSRNEMGALREIVQKFRSLAVYFRKSSKGNNRLGAIQVQHCNVRPDQVRRPTVDCPTRWNSCFEMLKRLTCLEGALTKFFAYLKKPEGRKEFKDMENKLHRPKPEDWLAIKCLQTLLGAFAVVSDMLGGQSYPTVPLVLPALFGIRKHLERTDLFDVHVAEAEDEGSAQETEFMMNECRKAMLALYSKRFKALEKSELKWVSFLDPRVAKRMSHLSPVDTPSACKEVVKAMVDLARKHLPGEECDTPAQRSTPDVQGMKEYVFDMVFGPDFVPVRPTKLEEDCDKEFKRYLAAVASVKSNISPLDWWRVNTINYPNMSRLARKWLGTVATSVPSERAFSTSGNIVTVKRGSLSPSMVRDLVFIAENWHIVQQ